MNRHFLKKTFKWPKMWEKVFSISRHQGNASSSLLRCHLTPVRMSLKRQAMTTAGQDAEKQESLWAVGGSVNGAATKENSMEALRKLSRFFHTIQQSHFGECIHTKRVQTFSHKVSKLWGSDINMVTVIQNTTLYNWNLSRVEFKCLHQKRKKDKHVKWWIYQLSKWGRILSQDQIITVYTVCTLQIYLSNMSQ